MCECAYGHPLLRPPLASTSPDQGGPLSHRTLFRHLVPTSCMLANPPRRQLVLSSQTPGDPASRIDDSRSSLTARRRNSPSRPARLVVGKESASQPLKAAPPA